jgi:glycosyltransferase involved in cell wall biosynthesis
MSTRKIKLLHIITHLDLGGAQKVSLALIKSLNNDIFDIHFISSPGGKLIGKLTEIPHIKVKLLPFLGRKIINLPGDLISLIQLISYIKRYKFDIVHTHSPKAGILGRWAARLCSVPVIIHTIHGFPFCDKRKSFLNEIYIFFEAITASITHKLIAVCESDITKGLSNKIGTPDKYILIKEGISPDDIVISEHKIRKEDLNIPASSRLVIMISCLKKQKSPLDFIKAAALVANVKEDVRFILVGDGPLRGKAERLIRKLKLENKFLILGWREDALDIASLSDVITLTSLWEGLPIALLEAMYLNKPIVATAADGVNELIKDGENGYLVNPEDYFSLANRINELLDNKELAASFAERSRINIMPNYEISRMTGKSEELYMNLAGGFLNEN